MGEWEWWEWKWEWWEWKWWEWEGWDENKRTESKWFFLLQLIYYNPARRDDRGFMTDDVLCTFHLSVQLFTNQNLCDFQSEVIYCLTSQHVFIILEQKKDSMRVCVWEWEGWDWFINNNTGGGGGGGGGGVKYIFTGGWGCLQTNLNERVIPRDLLQHMFVNKVSVSCCWIH